MFFRYIFIFFIMLTLAGCKSRAFNEMYYGKKRSSQDAGKSDFSKDSKYSSESNIDRLDKFEINEQERSYLKNYHRSMDSTRDGRRKKVFGGWLPDKE